jgi:colanic acid/amylovoran biosynthesis glycosyltransferase
LRIILVAGTFPQISEAFILRKAIALAELGYQVTVATRRCGNWESFHDYLPLPVSLSIQSLLPEWGWRNPRRAMALMAGLTIHSVRSPLRAFNLIKTCHRHPSTRATPWRQFIRHLPFLHNHADVVHFEFLGLGVMYPLIPKLLAVPMVVSCRGTELHLLDQRSPQQKADVLDCLRRADAIHCVSDKMANQVAEVCGRENSRTSGIWVNRPAVATDKIIPKNNWTGNDPPLIMAVGRLVWIKGYDYLLAALSRLKQEGIAFRAQIIGDGPLYAPLSYSIEDLDLKPEVELLGSLPSTEVLQRLRSADLFVLSSHAEGISNAAIEAMAMGLPVVTTNAGGMAEAISDDIEGYVVPVRDIQSMADRIKSLLTNSAKRERMGLSARSRAEAEFSLGRQAQVFEQMYQTVIPNRKNSYYQG